MIIKPTQNKGTNFELVPAGNYNAVCTMIVDLGSQDSNYKGTVSKKRKVRFGWELSKKMQDGRPFMVTRDFTLSLGDKAALKPVLQNWRGSKFTDEELDADFDITAFLTKGCLVQVVHNEYGGKTYANVSNVSALPEGMPALEPVGTIYTFNLDDYNQAQFDALWPSIKAKVMASPEYMAVTKAADIPFGE